MVKKKIDDDYEKALSEKFMSSNKFVESIEHISNTTGMNYIDSICHFCEKNNIEVESIIKLISKPLKEKIKNDATQLNFLKKTTRAKSVFNI
jgi:hypothetical protein